MSQTLALGDVIKLTNKWRVNAIEKDSLELSHPNVALTREQHSSNDKHTEEFNQNNDPLNDKFFLIAHIQRQRMINNNKITILMQWE